MLVVLISCASRARAQGAINCTMELVAALNNGAVQRLKKTWDLVSRKDKQTFEELEEFVSSKVRDKCFSILHFITREIGILQAHA